MDEALRARIRVALDREVTKLAGQIYANMRSERVLSDEEWERAEHAREAGGRHYQVTRDGQMVIHDGEWRLVFTGPTLGRYRIFDGWWKDTPEQPA